MLAVAVCVTYLVVSCLLTVERYTSCVVVDWSSNSAVRDDNYRHRIVYIKSVLVVLSIIKSHFLIQPDVCS